MTRFDAAIRKVFKEVDIFQKITLQEKCAVFQQKYDSKLKMWIDMESPFAAIMEIITLLLENNQGGIHKPCGQRRGVCEKTMTVHKGAGGGGVRGRSTWTNFLHTSALNA